MSGEDKQQEYERIKLDHPDYQHYQVSRDLIDVQRSRAWSDSWCGRFKHIPFDDSSFVVMPSISDDLLDLFMAIDQLPEQQRELMVLLLQGYRKKEIAKLMGITQGCITQIYNKAIQQMRDALCHSEI